MLLSSHLGFVLMRCMSLSQTRDQVFQGSVAKTRKQMRELDAAPPSHVPLGALIWTTM